MADNERDEMLPELDPGTRSPAPDPMQSSAGASAAALATELATDGSASPDKPSGGYRWVICALIFFATTINYIDRQVLGILAPMLEDELGWSETDYAAIVSYFTFAYMLGFLFAGRLMDRIGTKMGYSIAIVVWSLAAMAHALAGNATGFSIARFALGLGESGNFPGAIKTTAEWFPRKERAFATGIFNAGTNVGALLTPMMVPWIAINWGWRMAFIVTGALGFVWLVAWLAFYKAPEEHPRVSPAELAYIRSDLDPPARPVAWLPLLSYRQTWAFTLGKFLTDGVWWFYLFWLPKFLDATYGVKLAGLAAPLIVIYLIADVGSVGGGWLSGYFMSRGASVNRGRKLAMLVMALLIVPTMLTPHVDNMWGAVLFVSLAAAAHQGWSANLFTLTSDLFPRHAVGSIVGIGGAAGALGGFLFQRVIGNVLEANGSDYTPIFFVTGSMYVIAWLVIHFLVPRMERAELRD